MLRFTSRSITVGNRVRNSWRTCAVPRVMMHTNVLFSTPKQHHSSSNRHGFVFGCAIAASTLALSTAVMECSIANQLSETEIDLLRQIGKRRKDIVSEGTVKLVPISTSEQPQPSQSPQASPEKPAPPRTNPIFELSEATIEQFENASDYIEAKVEASRVIIAQTFGRAQSDDERRILAKLFAHIVLSEGAKDAAQTDTIVSQMGLSPELKAKLVQDTKFSAAVSSIMNAQKLAEEGSLEYAKAVFKDIGEASGRAVVGNKLSELAAMSCLEDIASKYLTEGVATKLVSGAGGTTIIAIMKDTYQSTQDGKWTRVAGNAPSHMVTASGAMIGSHIGAFLGSFLGPPGVLLFSVLGTTGGSLAGKKAYQEVFIPGKGWFRAKWKETNDQLSSRGSFIPREEEYLEEMINTANSESEFDYDYLASSINTMSKRDIELTLKYAESLCPDDREQGLRRCLSQLNDVHSQLE